MTTTRIPNRGLDERVVSNVMRDGVIACTPETPLVEVARLMSEHCIHCVVVAGLGRDGRGTRVVWGVVSDLDLARAAASGSELTAGQVAATEPVTASPADTLSAVARMMGDHDVAHLLVIDDKDAEPIGVISSLDIARAFAEAG
jgi:CBS domain-containing protein